MAAGKLDKPRILFTVLFVNTLLSATGPATMYLVVRTVTTAQPVLWPLWYSVFLSALIAPYAGLALVMTQRPALTQKCRPC